MAEKTRPANNAHAERLKDFQTTPANGGGINFRYQEECDVDQGENYRRESSRSVSTLEECEKSCMDDALCQSIAMYSYGWCAHFSTSVRKGSRPTVRLRYN